MDSVRDDFSSVRDRALRILRSEGVSIYHDIIAEMYRQQQREHGPDEHFEEYGSQMYLSGIIETVNTHATLDDREITAWFEQMEELLTSVEYDGFTRPNYDRLLNRLTDLYREAFDEEYEFPEGVPQPPHGESPLPDWISPVRLVVLSVVSGAVGAFIYYALRSDQ